MESKACSKCGELHSLDFFNKDKRRPDGRATLCKNCTRQKAKDYRKNNPERVKHLDALSRKRHKDARHKRSIEYREQHADEIKNRLYERKYGITFNEKEGLFNKIDGKCMICSAEMTLEESQLDHDHESREIRGILCINCNLLLGHAKDDVSLLEAAIDYLNNPPLKLD